MTANYQLCMYRNVNVLKERVKDGIIISEKRNQFLYYVHIYLYIYPQHLFSLFQLWCTLVGAFNW